MRGLWIRELRRCCPAERPEAIPDCDDAHALGTGERCAVVNGRARSAGEVGAAVEPHQHGKALLDGLARDPEVR
jgi:hypothetical protein